MVIRSSSRTSTFANCKPLRIRPRLCALLLLAAGWATGQEAVRLDLFTTPGCPSCERFERGILPQLESRYSGFYELIRHDLNQPDAFALLAAYARKEGVPPPTGISLVIDRSTLLSGSETVSTGLFAAIDMALSRRQEPSWRLPDPPAINPDARPERMARLTWPVILLGGLTDGVNPCAIATLIFFLSVLAAAHASRRTRLVTAAAFISASFATYWLLGAGFLFFFRQIPLLPVLKKTAEGILILALIILAGLSLRDALRFRRNPDPVSVALHIPRRTKARIHAWTRNRWSWGGPLLGGILTGAGVTLLESVCTGQGYLPVLASLLKSDSGNARLLLYLTVYNLLFILPLLVIAICFLTGSAIPALIAWSRRHLVPAKIALACFYLLLAILLALL